jgi:chaperonin GroEL
VLRALEAPIRQIAENSSMAGSIVADKVLESGYYGFGFDAQTEDYKDLVTHHRPAALQDAASVAGLLITTEAMVAETPKKEVAGHAWRRHGRMDF